MSTLVSKLKGIYKAALYISLPVFLVDAFTAPKSFSFPLGPIVFALMAVFSRYLLQYLIDRYGLKVNKDEFYNIGVVFMLSCGVMGIVLGLLYIIFVPIK
ncbi:MAG TPA: hypothetical protein VL020_07350 [Pseudomonadales bacterium]|nr:hypothetical protein [Pseudomonas sp.]HHX34457.1 hypothetical protein [Gammaproteobacteria bacterium]HUH58304.1 hypothetical protein [Pseudomonadales bacterium]